MVVCRFDTLINNRFDSKEIAQFKYQSYLTFLWHGKNSSHNDKYCEYFYHPWICTPKRHEILPKIYQIKLKFLEKAADFRFNYKEK